MIAMGATIYLRVYGNSSCAGLGRPVPIAPTKFLLTTAVYRHVRNPMYIGVALVILGEAVMFCSPHVAVNAVAMLLIARLFVVF